MLTDNKMMESITKVDMSIPPAAIAILYHVGSNFRGFLFLHILWGSRHSQKLKYSGEYFVLYTSSI